jgi:hypothetical protein
MIQLESHRKDFRESCYRKILWKNLISFKLFKALNEDTEFLHLSLYSSERKVTGIEAVGPHETHTLIPGSFHRKPYEFEVITQEDCFISSIYSFCALLYNTVSIWITYVAMNGVMNDNLFCNPILFAICISTLSKLCKNMYTVACRRVLTSTPL